MTLSQLLSLEFLNFRSIKGQGWFTRHMQRFGPEDFGAQFVRLDQFGGAWTQRGGAVYNLGKQKKMSTITGVCWGVHRRTPMHMYNEKL